MTKSDWPALWREHRKEHHDQLEHDERIDGACTAMAMVMTFVWMEALCTSGVDRALTTGTDLRMRRWAVGAEIDRGLLRSEWP